MPIPAAKYEHRVLVYNCGVTKSIEGLSTFSLNLLPLIPFIFNAALVHITIPFLTIVAAVHEDATIPENHSMVCPLTWYITRLFLKGYIKPT